MSGSGWDYFAKVQGRSLGSSAPTPGVHRTGLGAGEAQQAIIDRWRGDMQEARERFVTPVTDAIAQYNQISGIVSRGVDIVGQLGSMRTSEDVFRFMDSLSSMVSMAGPIGAVAGAFLEFVNDLARWLSSSFPAFAIQLQQQNYAYMDKFLSENLLGVRGDAAHQSAAIAGALGWVPIHVIYDSGGGGFCMNSGGRLRSWSMAPGRGPANAAENVRLFSLVAGPRDVPLRQCTKIQESEMAAWKATPEGVASVAEAEGLAGVLSHGGYTAIPLQGTSAKGYKSNGLAFWNNVRFDIDPGTTEYNIWQNGFFVNVAALPNDLLIPLATYIILWTEAAGVYGTEASIPGEELINIRKAAFGENDEAFKKWNLLRLLYNSGNSSDYIRSGSTIRFIPNFLRASPAIMAEFVARRPAARLVARAGTMTAMPISSAISPAVVVGGLGVLGLLAWLALK